MLNPQTALDVVIEIVEVDQCKELAEQVADRNPDWPAIVGIEHHQVNQAVILDLALNQSA